MKLNLSSNIFSNNKALNGGGLYLKDEYSNDNSHSENNSIIIENNNFTKNRAVNEGGAIYSDYSKFHLTLPENNTISYNKAGIMGGGVYSLYSEDKNILNNEHFFNMTNNTVESHINNIGSKPSYITLESDNYDNEIHSGEYIQLSFKLYDKFGNILEDYSNYYSSLVLKVELIEENKQNIYENNNNINDEYDLLKENIDYKLFGNVGSFNNGKKIENIIIKKYYIYY